jgi:CheY-like chemotaxis protein
LFKKAGMRVATSFTVFLIDDDKDEAELYTEAIREANLPIELYFFEKGEYMLNHLQKNKLPHLIVMDANLPGLSGLDCLIRIKAEEDYKNIPVVMCTSIHDERTSEASSFEGALSYNLKPATFSGYQNLLRSFYNICTGNTNFTFGKTA